MLAGRFPNWDLFTSTSTTPLSAAEDSLAVKESRVPAFLSGQTNSTSDEARQGKPLEKLVVVFP